MKILILNNNEMQYIRNCIMNDYEIIRKKNKKSLDKKIFKKFNIVENENANNVNNKKKIS